MNATTQASPDLDSSNWMRPITATFRPPFGTFARENISAITSRGSRRYRQTHLSDGPDGHGMPVLLIPGFLTGDWSMRGIAMTLRGWDFRPAKAGVVMNVDCTRVMVDRMEQRLEVLAERYQQKVAIAGWSRGGTLGKLVATSRPDLVSGLVTLVSPNANPLAVSTSVARQLKLMVRLSTSGVRGLMTEDCIQGECGRLIGEMLERPFPETVPYVSVFTKTDGVVDWRACLDPDARLVEVSSTHLGIGNDPRIVRLMGSHLATMKVAA